MVTTHYINTREQSRMSSHCRVVFFFKIGRKWSERIHGAFPKPPSRKLNFLEYEILYTPLYDSLLIN